MPKLKIIILSVIVLAAFFIGSGYYWSDDKFFNDLIGANGIDSPEKAFAYLGENTDFVTGNPMPIPYRTPRCLLEVKHLWCDEGAIVLATIVHELDYPTRLVDVIKDDGEAGHTYLQIFENGEWVNYDTVLMKSGLTHQQILDGYVKANIYINGYPRPRPYPRPYNWIVQNNFYLKHLALRLRGVRE